MLSKAGLSSRRGAISIIKTGQVSVNGKVIVEPGFKVKLGDVVLLNDKVVPFSVEKKYFIINKPRGYLSSRKDDFGRSLVIELIPKKLRKGLFPVGRLDYFSEGLILLTNDGDWAQLFIRPKHQILKEYLVTIDRPLTFEALKQFEKGLEIKGEMYKAEKVEYINPHTLKVTLIEGKNREIRKVIHALGSKVNRLVRIKIGFLSLDGLEPGRWRKLTKSEIEMFWKYYGYHD